MGTRWRLGALAMAVAATLAAGGCIGSPTPVPQPPAPGPAVTTPASSVSPKAKRPAPGTGHPVGLRVLHLQRGHDRPLTTLLFFPATPTAAPPTAVVAAAATAAPGGAAHSATSATGAASTPAGTDAANPAPALADPAKADPAKADPALADPATADPALADPAAATGATPPPAARTAVTSPPAATDVPSPGAASGDAPAEAPPGLDLPTGFSVVGDWDWTPARGRFPLVLFSHGLSGSPQRYAAMLSGWAAAGFVVVAPIYPHTSEFTTAFRRRDIVNQPADARYVLNQVQRLDAKAGDPLRGHLDVDRVAAVGHSAGGYTTLGLFTARHDPRLRAAVVMAGWLPPTSFAGPPATMLFLQGTADPVVPAAISRAAYDRVPWPKSYLLLNRNSHATYLRPGERGYAVMESTVLNFLRWTLKRDQAAGRKLPRTHYPGTG